MTLAYWNGAYAPLESVKISPLDRGFLFADGVYEVVAFYGRRLFQLDEHLERLGSFWGHGSGDLSLGFTTASRIAHGEMRDFVETRMLNERRIDLLFQAVTEATEESVLDAMLSSTTTAGRAGHSRQSLAEALEASQDGGSR
jgi:hypothetical protein